MIRVTIDMDPQRFGQEQQEALQQTVAAVLDTSPHQVQITSQQADGSEVDDELLLDALHQHLASLNADLAALHQRMQVGLAHMAEKNGGRGSG